MKRWFGIALLAAYLGSATEFHELLKLPALTCHYFDHRGGDGLPGLADFLAMHYGQNGDHSQDHDHKGKLPFKSKSVSCTATAIALVPVNGALLPALQPEGQPVLVAADFPTCSQGYHATVWQPPQA